MFIALRRRLSTWILNVEISLKNSTGGKHVSPVLTSDASISITISIRSLCASEDSRDIGISISFLVRLMLMLMFSEDIVDIGISAR